MTNYWIKNAEFKLLSEESGTGFQYHKDNIINQMTSYYIGG